MNKKATSFDIQRVSATRPRAAKVAVQVPVSVAYDLDRFQQVQKDILGRLGCPGCTSGHDIRFDTYSQFAVDEALDVRLPGF